MNTIGKLFSDIRNNHIALYRGALAIGAALIILALYPAKVSFNYEYYSGTPWQNEDLLAPFDFAILKSEAELKKEKELISQSIIPVYTRDYNLELNYEDQFNSQWNEHLSTLSIDQADSIYIEDLRLRSVENLRSVFEKGIVLLDNENGKPSIDGFIFLELEDGGHEKSITAFLNLIGSVQSFNALNPDSSRVNIEWYEKIVEQALDYNIHINNSKTELIAEDANEMISLFKGKIDKGTIIVQRGEIVNKEIEQVLESLKKQYDDKMGSSQNIWLLLLSSFLFILIILWITYNYLMRFIQSVVQSSAGWSFILLIYILVVALVKVSVYDNGLSQHLVPMLIFPLIIRAFFDLRLAIFIHILNVVLTASLVTNPYEFIILQIIVGLVVLFSLKNLRRRAQFFLTALIIFLVYSVIYFSIEIYKVSDISLVDWKSFQYFGINALFTLFAYPLIYLFEKIFGFISEVTLIEMTDMNNQLLRDLAEKAPGTFQHSLQVANMAEAAIHKIGGYELLVRVGALYHDIGKMKNPMFFIENQVHGINPHDELSYDESSQLIIQHVLDGISLAKKANLPDQIVDFIRTHHGSTRVEYFYRSFKLENPDVEIDEALFTYPGPKPYSKETAVLMMADGVEAASRSMKTYDSESIEKLVHSIINSLIEKDQFSNANITFKDISIVKKIFVKMLINVYHVRIEYPHAS